MTALRRGLLIVLLLLVALPAGAGYWVLATEPGSRWAIGQAFAALGAASETGVGAVEGRLWDRVTVHDIRISDTTMALRIERLRLDWRPVGLLGRRLRIRDLTLTGIDYRQLAADPDTGETVPWRGFSTPVGVDLEHLGVDRGSFGVGDTVWRLPRAELSARLAQSRLEVRALSGELGGPGLEFEITTASASAELTQTLPYGLQLAWRGELPELGASRGSGRVTGDLQHVRLDHRLVAPTPIDIGGSASLGTDPEVDLIARWPHLRWPLTGAAQFATGAGELEVTGPVSGYRLRLRADLVEPAWVSGTLSAQASGDDTGFSALTARLAALGGEVDANGDLRWLPVPEVALDVDARGLDPARSGRAPPGRLDLALATRLRFPESGAVGELTIDRIDGVFAEQPVAGRGRVRIDGDEITIERLLIENGRNRVRAQGTAGERLALTGDATIAGLDQYLPELSGTVDADWTLAGSVADPVVAARLSAQGLGWTDIEAGRIDADIDWPGLAADAPFVLSLAAADVRRGGQELGKLRVGATGRPSEHRIRLDVSHPRLTTALAVVGGLETDGDLAQARWLGTIDRFDVAETALGGVWALRAPAGLELSRDRLHLRQPLCLDAGAAHGGGGAGPAAGSVCTDAHWSAADGIDVDTRIAALPLAWFDALLPPGWSTRGRLDATVALSGHERVQGQIDARVASAVLTTPLVADGAGVPLEDIALAAGLAPEGDWSATARVGLRDHGTLEGRLAGSPDGGDYRLDGAIAGLLTDLSALGAVTDAVAPTGGRLDLDIGISGTTERPRVGGRARLDALALGVPALGTEFTAIGLTVRAVDNTRLAFTGGARAGDGELQLDGEASLDAAAGYPLQLAITGRDALVSRLPEAEVRIAPDLELRGDTGGYRLRGSLLIPQAQFEIAEIPPDVVSVSRDQQIVGAESDGDRDVPATELVDTDIVLRLGDAVSLSGFGLDTRLTGELSLRARPGAEPQGFGDIVLADASYRAYGQDLTVDRGRLIFAGPLDDPGIDVRAYRVSRDERVKAWLEVGDRASAPRLRVFAEPELPETEALSYLLTGEGVAQSGGADKSRVYAAALSWGVGRGEPVLAELQEQLGLSELAFEGGDTLEESGVRVGKYLNPNLYVGYGLGLFSRASELLLRFHLNENLTVESRSGDTQSADVFYQIERD